MHYLKAEKKAKMQHNYHLQRRVQDFKEEYEHWEPWLDKYSIITLEIGRLSFPTNIDMPHAAL